MQLAKMFTCGRIALLVLCLTGGGMLAASAAYAAAANATQKTVDVKEDKGQQAAAEAKTFATPIFVELQGTDTIGARLSMQVQELLNKSSLFSLTAKDEPKIRILLSTVPEFGERPAVGSAYSIIWLYYDRPTSFTSYLDAEVGVVGPDEVNSLAMRLLEKTATLSSRYSYIFKQ